MTPAETLSARTYRDVDSRSISARIGQVNGDPHGPRYDRHSEEGIAAVDTPGDALEVLYAAMDACRVSDTCRESDT